MWLLAALLLADSASVENSFKVPLTRTESLAVATAGVGDPVVLIPGLFGSEFGFRKLVPLLNAAGYRTIVIEPLGVGSSGRPAHADYSLTAQADRIAAVLDSLGVRGALVIAHSIGGAEAVRLACRRPHLVRGPRSLPGGAHRVGRGAGVQASAAVRAVDQAVRGRRAGSPEDQEPPARVLGRFGLGHGRRRIRVHGRGGARSERHTEGVRGDGERARTRKALAASLRDPLSRTPHGGRGGSRRGRGDDRGEI